MGAIQLDVDGAEVWLETVAPEGRSRMGYTGDSDEAEGGKTVAPSLIADAVRGLAKNLSLELTTKKSPDELHLDFGLSLDPSSRVVIGQSGTFHVSMRWKKSS